ncbi:MAG: C-terminal binding protein [Gemmatimonadota bacterium]|nr:C-terminal binding protein [Gemmatimonadota bacterium]
MNRLEDTRIVRLNAEIMPVTDTELTLWARYGFSAIEVEAAVPDDIIPHVADCDAVFVVSAELPRPVIDSLSKCRIISRLGNGTDKIDVQRATERGIVVSNVPYFCVDEMSDHVMAMVLSLSRRIPWMSRYMHEGAYRRARAEALQLPRLASQVLGIVGFGASGKAVARRARSFGMTVIATRRAMAGPHPEAEEFGVEMVELTQLLERSDFLSLQLPLTRETYHLFDCEMLRSMKRGSFLINTSRGAIVDEDALADLLEEGHLAGAGLDTFESIEIFNAEETPPTHRLAELDNVILTPHVSGLSVQASENVSVTGVENVAAVMSGHLPDPDNIVNKGVVPRCPLVDHDPSMFGPSS